MKKTFKLTHEKIKPARLADSIKNEVKKYIKRERKRALPKGADFWAFDCRFGATADTSQAIHEAEINQYISQAEADQLQSFYLEVIAKPATRTHKPDSMRQTDEDDLDSGLEDDYIHDFEDNLDYEEDLQK